MTDACYKLDSPSEWLRQMDHTADMGIIVQAGNRKELFARAAWGMFSMIANMDAIRPSEKIEISLEAPDIEALMVKWLSELNFRHITERKLFRGFHISRLAGRELKAQVYGEPIQPRHALHTEIKAVTFHKLRVERTGGRWLAQVLFDV